MAAMTSWRGVVVLAALAARATRVSLGPVPDPHSIATLWREFVYAKPQVSESGAVADRYMPSFGWGLWDAPYPTLAKAVVSGAHMNVTPDIKQKYEENPPLWITLMRNEDFWNEFVPHQNNSHFCCTSNDVESGACSQVRQLRLPETIKSRVLSAPVALSTSTSALVTDASFPISSTGVYYLLLTNCMDEASGMSPPSAVSLLLSSVPGSPRPKLKGRVYINGTHGYLSGVDVPKLHFYFSTTVCWAALCLTWMILTLMQEDPCIHFAHNFMSLTLLVALFEQLMNFIYLSWENDSSLGSRWIVKALRVAGNASKDAIGASMILLLCVGTYSVLPIGPMVPHLKAKVWLIAVGLGLSQFGQSFAATFQDSLNLSSVLLFLLNVPTLLIGLGGGYWAWRSLNRNIFEMRRQHNLVKETMLLRVRATLVVAAVCYTISLACQGVAYLADPEQLWKYEWFFTDGAPELLFLFVITATMLVIRPDETVIDSPIKITDKRQDEDLPVDSVQIDPRLYEEPESPEGLATVAGSEWGDYR